MARQSGILPIEGTLGNITFFKTKDGYMVREKGGVSPEKIASDPAFQRTRENNAEFGRAGKASRLFRNAFRVIIQKASDSRMVSRLVKVMMQVIHEDTVNPRGLRNVIDGEALFLEGFECNANGKLSTSMYAPYTATVNRTTGAVAVNIPAFIPAEMIAAPAGATHFRLSFNTGVIDFESEQFTVDTTEGDFIAWNNTATALIDFTGTLPAASASPIFVLLAIEFVQEVNAVKYPLKNGSFNACAIVKVDA